MPPTIRPRLAVPLLFAALVGATAHAGPTVIYVDASAPVGGNGLSWATAFRDLQAGLAASAAPTVIQVWVADGVYKPDGGTLARGASFVVPNGRAVYGGFAGGESSLMERDPDVHLTVLSGDLLGNDAPGFSNRGDNSFNVVRATGLSLPTRLDGFVIRGGNANGTAPQNRGGGIAAIDDDSIGRFIVSQCRIEDNQGGSGGGAYFERGDVLVEFSVISANRSTVGNGGGLFSNLVGIDVADCEITGNEAKEDGGGLRYESGSRSPTITRSTFFGNSSGRAGGGLSFENPLLSNLAVTIRDSRFEANTTVAPWVGGGANIRDCRVVISGSDFIQNASGLRGGALAINANDPFSMEAGGITLCRFIGNFAAQSGGAIVSTGSDGLLFDGLVFSGNVADQEGGAVQISPLNPTTQRFRSCTFAYNTAGTVGGALRIPAGTELTNCIVWGNEDASGSAQNDQITLWEPGPLQVTTSRIEGWTGSFGGVGNGGGDPLFADPFGPDGSPGSEDDDLRLTAGSSCIDAGSNAALAPDSSDVDGDANTAELQPLDIAGNPRRFDEPLAPDVGIGDAPIVDIGALESGVFPEPIVFTGAGSAEWSDARSWSGGSTPDQNTPVVVAGSAVVSLQGAVAREIRVTAGSSIALVGGTLETGSIIVEPGALIVMIDEDSLLAATSLNFLPGAQLQWTAGTIEVTQGSLAHGSPLAIGCVGSATLRLLDDASVTASSVTVCTGGLLEGTGLVAGSLINHGVVAPGLPNGTLGVAGAYTQSASGALRCRPAGYAPGTADRLNVAGAASLAGALVVDLEENFVPTIGGVLTLVSAAPLSGAFSTTQIVDPRGLPGFLLQTSSQAVGLLTQLSSSGPRLYVDQDSSGGDGQSWAGALRHLDEALAAADFLDGQVTEIWVAAGRYVPSPSDPDQTPVFTILDGVSLYGGFAGTETSINERNLELNETILDGDRLGNDQPGFVNFDDNRNRVVASSSGNPFASTPVFDGFTVRGARLRGMECFTAAPTIRACTFRENLGGGLRYNATGAVVGSVFGGNRSDSTPGAGMRIDSQFVNVAVRGCLFHLNQTTAFNGGGGLSSDCDNLLVIETDFIGNTSSTIGGGASAVGGSRFLQCRFLGNTAPTNGGGLSVPAGAAGKVVSIVNCLFSGNKSVNGTGAGVHLATANTTHQLLSSTFANNSAGSTGAGGVNAANLNTKVNLRNTILWGNTGSSNVQTAQIGGTGPKTPSYCTIQGWTGSLGGVANNGLNPQFIDPDGADNTLGTSDDLPAPGIGSPCVDSGLTLALGADEFDLDGDGNTIELWPLDISGAPRFSESIGTPNTGCGGGVPIDRGAFELIDGLPGPEKYSGDLTGDGAVDGADLAILLGEWGATGPCIAGDVNSSGAVNGADLAILLSQFGL
jgi:hypothetical protein